VLAVDVSGSINADRYALQMEGIAKAFEDREVQRILLRGPNHSMLVALVEWSNTASLTIPWTLITSRSDAQAFADRVRLAPRVDNQFTCMSRALQLIEGKVIPFLPVPADRTVSAPRGCLSRFSRTCKLVFSNDTLATVDLALDAVLERASCFGEEANDLEEVAFGVLLLLIPVGRKVDLLANGKLVHCHPTLSA
jgi:hypothetical protein